jgi:hypothetical protein
LGKRLGLPLDGRRQAKVIQHHRSQFGGDRMQFVHGRFNYISHGCHFRFDTRIQGVECAF